MVFRPHPLARLGFVLVYCLPPWAVWSEGSPTHFSQIGLAVAVSGICLWGAVRAWRASVSLTADALIVRGWTRDVRMPRRSVTGVTSGIPDIEWLDKAGVPRRTRLHIFRTDVPSPIRFLNKQLEDQVAALREALGFGRRRGRRRR